MLDDSMVETKKIISEMLLLWAGLTSLSSTYEEVCREWFLPTFLGDCLS